LFERALREPWTAGTEGCEQLAERLHVLLGLREIERLRAADVGRARGVGMHDDEDAALGSPLRTLVDDGLPLVADARSHGGFGRPDQH